MAQFGGEILFRKIGEDGVSSLASHTTQGIFVGHYDRTRAISCITKSGIVRGKSLTKQTSSDAWELTNWEDLLDNPWHMVITETRLQEVIADEEGAGLLLPRVVVKNLWRLSVEDSTFCLRILTFTDTLEVVRDTRCLHRMEKRQNHVRTNSESESERLLGEP